MLKYMRRPVVYMRRPVVGRDTVTIALPLLGLMLFALGMLACATAAEPSDGEPWLAAPAPTDAVAPNLATATPLPTAAPDVPATPLATARVEPYATTLPAATPLPVSAEGGVTTVDAEQAEQIRRKYERLLQADWRTDFSRTSIDYDEIMTGGPPKDGIPAIDEPAFESVAEADEWLDDREAVQAVDINGDARAYPVQVMVWHELVNDTVGGEAVVITF